MCWYFICNSDLKYIVHFRTYYLIIKEPSIFFDSFYNNDSSTINKFLDIYIIK